MISIFTENLKLLFLLSNYDTVIWKSDFGMNYLLPKISPKIAKYKTKKQNCILNGIPTHKRMQQFQLIPFFFTFLPVSNPYFTLQYIYPYC